MFRVRGLPANIGEGYSFHCEGFWITQTALFAFNNGPMNYSGPYLQCIQKQFLHPDAITGTNVQAFETRYLLSRKDESHVLEVPELGNTASSGQKLIIRLRDGFEIRRGIYKHHCEQRRDIQEIRGEIWEE